MENTKHTDRTVSLSMAGIGRLFQRGWCRQGGGQPDKEAKRKGDSGGRLESAEGREEPAIAIRAKLE